MKTMILAAISVVMVGGSVRAQTSTPAQTEPPANEAMEMYRHHADHWRHHEAEHQPQGAMLRFKHGDVEVTVRCAATDAIATCVSSAKEFIDKVDGMQAQPTATK